MLVDAYHKARCGKRRTVSEHNFEVYALENLIILRDAILARRYEPGPSNVFKIEDPKVREIFAAGFMDRVVHHFVFSQTFPWWDRRLSYESFSCREGKGTLHAIQRLNHHILSVSENYCKETYYIQVDVKSYFTSIDKNILLKIILDGLDKQFPKRGPMYRTLKFLWKKIIMDDAVSKMVVRGPLKELDKVPPHKSLRYQPPGIGLVIGNLTSQGGSNAYLDKLDRFLRFELDLKHFVRYVDDLVIIIPKTERFNAKDIVRKIDIFLCNELGLCLNPQKTVVRDIHDGIEFLGVVIYPGRIIPGKRLKHNFRKKCRLIAEGRKSIDDLGGMLGLFLDINSEKFVSEVFDNLGWEHQPFSLKAGAKKYIKRGPREKEQRNLKISTGTSTRPHNAH